MTDTDQSLVARLGPIEMDVMRSIGYFGGVSVAVAAGIIEPPLGPFVAAIPLVKMLHRPRLPAPVNHIGHVLDGVAKPVGGDAQGTVRVAGESDEPSSGTGAASADRGQADGSSVPATAAAKTWAAPMKRRPRGVPTPPKRLSKAASTHADAETKPRASASANTPPRKPAR